MTSISTNISTLISGRAIKLNQIAQTNSLAKMSTGLRINSGKDDPAGLITSENLRATLAALDAESRSLERADNVIATADSALGQVSDMLIEAEALTVANANSAGMSDEERQANQMQIDSIMSTVNRLASTTSFNGDQLLDGTATVSAAGESVTIDSVSMGPIGEGEAAQTALQAARSQVNTSRGQLGALSRNTIGSQLNNLAVTIENVASANSIIRDTDYAKEITNLMRAEIGVKASLRAADVSMHNTKQVLDLLG